MFVVDKYLVFVAMLSLGSSLAAPLKAEILSVGASGFEVRETAHVAASADKAYAVLLVPARWWSSDHTFSGNAANLTLDARAGGCWCEALPDGGSVEHLHVVYVAPGKVLRLRGALGPFQSLGADGAMTLSVKPSASGTEVSIGYTLGGYSKDGFEAASKAVDHVLSEQLERLKKTIDG
jgi:hypothetical protein